MKREQILNLPSIPAASPSYPHGPYRFINREFFTVIYESAKEAIREAVPEPLEPVPEGLVYYEPAIAAGREIWGFPKKHAEPKLEIATDTLTGTLHYAGQLVAMGTMTYKHMPRALNETHESLRKMQVNLKLVPGVDGKP